MKRKFLSSAIQGVLGIATTAFLLPVSVGAQEKENKEILEEVIVTGSRITQPGIESTSPITSIGAEEIAYLQEPEIEKILRNLPATIPGDGGNVNNGTAGAATIDLRGLGPERNLVLMNGKRMVPFNFDGEVDTSTIPTALVERIDVVTGGASAVYGSDAIAGAVNVILKQDFEGLEVNASRSETGENDGRINNLSVSLGSNLAGDRGNVAMSMSWMEREAVLLGQRPLGLLGIDTEDGSNLAEFNAGLPPAPPPAGCGGPNVAASGGSTTAIPTRFSIVGGGTGTSQFREDGTLGDECSVFNFNPFNYYQTPQERYTATVFGHFDLTDKVEAYSTINFTNTTVVQQVAPSGTFGEAFDLPLSNPFIGAQALGEMISQGNTALGTGNLVDGQNWKDLNANGVVDAADELRVQLRRRTLELGPRVESFDSDTWQMQFGFRGDFLDDWNYDLSFQYGESNRTRVRAGYTNLGNIQNALRTTDGVSCPDGDIDTTCVPIDLFGGFGTITEDQVPYAQAIALIQEKYEQTILSGSISGLVNAVRLPTAEQPLAVSFGYESREEIGSQEPDECLKEAPSSCQGGAGGNLLPITGGYKVDDFFVEAIMPLMSGRSFADSMNLEMGYRVSDYGSAGTDDTWKFGVNWRPVDSLLLRVMQQQATRAPNVGELASPVVTGLDNAKQDPCSVANAANIDATLRALCISTGMTNAQVGTVQDVISGQVNTFDGSDPNALPNPETADTLTAGFVWTPDFNWADNFTLSVDYYDIDIEDVIGEFSAQETLDQCYTAGVETACAKINRVFGDLTISGSGVERFTTNLDFERAEGVEIALNFGFDLADMGNLQFSTNINKYLTQESQSSSLTPVLDCKGFFGTSCDPISELRWIQRTTWTFNEFSLSAQWRHIDSVDIEIPEASGVFPGFRQIDDYDYLDLYASYNFQDRFTFSLGIDNITDEDPPVVGNEAGDTAFNSGNTFPSNYDTLGRIYTLGVNLKF